MQRPGVQPLSFSHMLRAASHVSSLGGAKVCFLILLKHDMWMPTRADANQGLPW